MTDREFLQLRARVDVHQSALEQVAIPGVRDVTINEQITRKRVGRAEDRLDALELWQLSTFWDRLCWLFLGRLPAVVPDELVLDDDEQPELTRAQAEADIKSVSGVFDPALRLQ